MKKHLKLSLNKRLLCISLAGFLPMVILVAYLLVSLVKAADAYEEITQNVAYANEYVKDFKERMDYSMYLAMIGNKEMEELGNGETTVNGIVTVNPYEYIKEMESVCDKLGEMATVETNRSRVHRIKNTLTSLQNCVDSLYEQINGNTPYYDKQEYLEVNIKGLTSLVQTGIQDYIYIETTNLSRVREELNAKNQQTVSIVVTISLIAIAVAIVLTGIASRSITRPIRNLCDLTNKVAEGDFTVKTSEGSLDEIAVLTRSFNDMTQEIGDLVEDIKEQQENMRIAEIRLLQEQINPHFLYNTLDAIVWLAEEKRSEEVVKIVGLLSDFFRTSLSQGRDYITIQEEKKHIESYLAIQQFRYQDILDYEIQINEEVYDYMIPKLTLQPLVENALYHGIKNKRGKGMIRITGEREGENIILKVTDNGKGMSREEIERLKKKMEELDGGNGQGGFGISNVNQRIKHYYGQEYGVFFESEEGSWTEAAVIIGTKNIQPIS